MTPALPVEFLKSNFENKKTDLKNPRVTQVFPRKMLAHSFQPFGQL